MEYFRFIISFAVTKLIKVIKWKKEDSYKEILLVRLDHLGDVVCTLQAIKNIRDNYRNAQISLITGIWNQELFLNNKLIDELIIYNSPAFCRDKSQATRWKEKFYLTVKLFKKKIDLVIGFRDDFFTIILSICLLPKNRFDRGTVRITDKIKSAFLRKAEGSSAEHEIETNYKIVQSILKDYVEHTFLLDFSDIEKLWFNNFLSDNNLLAKQYAIIHPGASWKFKRWDSINFKKVCQYIFDKYATPSILIGSQVEKKIGEIINKDNNIYIHDFIGKLELRQSMQLIINSKIAICNDSSPMHIAAQAGIPTIGIMGPGDIEKFGPRGKQVKFLHKKVDCYPCAQIECKYPDAPCVNLNKVEEVQSLIDVFLERRLN